MNIIIPLGGKGERFSKEGYTQPKSLIKIFEKCMINYVLDNLMLSSLDHVFIIYDVNLDNYDFSNYIKTKYPLINLIKINNSKGAAETLYLGLNIILNNYEYHDKCLILDCDTFYTEDIRHIFNMSNDNMVFYTKNTDPNPIYSYIKMDDDKITNIQEKVKISDNANTGAYAFTNIKELFHYCKYVLDNDIKFNNEPYTSCVISEMIKSDIKFVGCRLNKIFSLGTPKDVNNYINNTYAFLFDFDGTLVISDAVYFDVWAKILLNYNIILNDDMFKQYIQGNNDKYIVNTLLNKDIDISELKDNLVIENINKIKVINGVYDLIDNIKMLGHKICIVTNSNKKVVDEIIKYINIQVDFVIATDDCTNGKPHPEPYENAINKYNINKSKCIIFEDSKTGILSAKGVNSKLLVGIETIYNKQELLNLGVDLTIKDYCNLDINFLINTNPKLNNLKELLWKNSKIENIIDVIIDDHKLKGGFIADVISFKIISKNNIYHQILKYENTQENNLSNMAKKLQLYEREYYFYNNIKVNVNIPQFYNLVKDNNKTIGIVLENLIEKGYKINLNLNNDIDTTLKIIDRMADMHCQFWGKKLEFIKSTDIIFRPFFENFINERYDLFRNTWSKIININKCDEIKNNFSKIQESFSIGNNLTFIHGDIKSPNIFYDNDNNPYFIDWQHCAIGKGVQDLVFFVIESFDISNIKNIFGIAKERYYKKILEFGINYNFEEYENDIYNAICYIPFFTSVWFGTTPQDELIDKDFPILFISKLFYLIDLVSK